MTGILAAADETVTSSGWWQQAVSITLTVAAVVSAVGGALWVIYRFVPPIRDWWQAHKKKRQLERVEAMTAIVNEALDPVNRELRETNARIAIRHRANTDRLVELERTLNRIDHGQKEIHRRIDRHMDEEREERHNERVELLGWLNAGGFMRREDVQRFRDRRPSDDGPDPSAPSQETT